jgi:hypothetical protein
VLYLKKYYLIYLFSIIILIPKNCYSQIQKENLKIIKVYRYGPGLIKNLLRKGGNSQIFKFDRDSNIVEEIFIGSGKDTTAIYQYEYNSFGDCVKIVYLNGLRQVEKIDVAKNNKDGKLLPFILRDKIHLGPCDGKRFKCKYDKYGKLIKVKQYDIPSGLIFYKYIYVYEFW